MPYEYDEELYDKVNIEVECSEATCIDCEDGMCVAEGNIDDLEPYCRDLCICYCINPESEWDINDEKDLGFVFSHFRREISYIELEPDAKRVRLVRIEKDGESFQGLFRVSKESEEDYYYLPTKDGVDAIHGLIADADLLEPGRHSKLQKA